MRRKKQGQVLLIAVILLLVLTLLTTHMSIVAKMQYELSHVRRYTSNTTFHAQAAIKQVVEAIEKGLMNYEVTLLDKMKPLIYQYMVTEGENITDAVRYDITRESYQVNAQPVEAVVRAHAYLWVLEQYFKEGDKPINIQLSKQKQLYYEIRSERPQPHMVTQIKVKLYAGGMGGNIEGTSQLSKEKIESLANHKEVRRLLKEIEGAAEGQDQAKIELTIKRLEDELEKGYFLIEAIAQTKDGIKVYDTQQILGYVNLYMREPLIFQIHESYKWQGQPQGLLSYSLVCYGGIEDVNSQLKINDTMRSHEEGGRLESELDYRRLETLGMKKVEGPEVDISQYYDGDKPVPTILFIDREGPTVIGASLAMKNTFEGLIIARSPIVLKGRTYYKGSILCDAGLRVGGGGSVVEVNHDKNIFFKLPIQQIGLWEAFGLLAVRDDGKAVNQGVTLDERFTVYLNTHLIGATISHLEEGRMVD